MPRIDLKAKTGPGTEHRRAVVSLRWLLVILASYLTLFNTMGTRVFPFAGALVLAFSASNLLIMLISHDRFVESRVQRVIAILDIVFVSATLYFLRVPENDLHAAFIVIFVLAVIWRDLRLVMFSILAVGMLYGAFSYFRLSRLQPDINIERFLTLALFFVVSIFYVFFWERLIQDGKRSNAIVEENRLAELMVEITRSLSSSLNADEVLYSIVHRLRDALEAEECCIYRIDSRTGAAQMMMKASNPAERNIGVDLDRHPELKQASISRELRIVPDGKSAGLIAIPMRVNDSLLGLIEVRSARWRPIMAGSNVRFFEVISGAAANALRNAELFEEVERRAHTDFLTGLPNRQYFQTTLSVEMARAQRHNRDVSLLMIDLDFLKTVNDRYGHPNGDMVIRGVAETIRWSCRESDFAARYGGEEFAVILPETPLSGAVQVAERIRERIAAAQFPGIGRITASIGVSNYPVNARSKEDLIQAADRALYLAKNAGRDRVAHIVES